LPRCVAGSAGSARVTSAGPAAEIALPRAEHISSAGRAHSHRAGDQKRIRRRRLPKRALIRRSRSGFRAGIPAIVRRSLPVQANLLESAAASRATGAGPARPVAPLRTARALRLRARLL
jgi:hypothetical protein